jgi:hypothetical protein
MSPSQVLKQMTAMLNAAPRPVKFGHCAKTKPVPPKKVRKESNRKPRNLHPVKLMDKKTGKCFAGFKYSWSALTGKSKMEARFSPSGLIFSNKAQLIRALRAGLTGKRGKREASGPKCPEAFAGRELVIISYEVKQESDFLSDPEVFTELL